MVTITDAAVRQNIYETIYDLVNAISFSVASVTVTAAFNEADQDPPVVAIHPVDIETADFSLGVPQSTKTIKMMIDVWTRKRKDLDVISDEIMDDLGDRAYTGFHLVGTDESTALETPSDLKIHLKTITFTFMRR